MSATGLDPSAESTRFHGERRTWELTRPAFHIGRKVGSSLYLISVGLTAGWVIAVFFGAGLFFLAPRPVELAPGPAGESAKASAPVAESSWLLQSTNKLDRLSMAPAAGAPHPRNAATSEDDRAVRQPVGQNSAEINHHPALSDPGSAHAVEALPDQVLHPAPMAGAPMSAAMPEPSAEDAPGLGLTSHSLSSRKKPSQKPASGRGPSRPPTQAIQDVLQKHSQVLK